MLPKTIDEVITRLEEIIDEQLQNSQYSSLFTYIYLITTKAVKKGIIEQKFEDNERMEAFDVRFANLFIEAYQNHQIGQPIRKSWEKALGVGEKSLTIIQHILLGMNAHINLDLGIAAAEISKGRDIHLLKSDFDTINEILFGLTKQVQNKIGRVSPLFFLIDNVIVKKDEEIVNFSIQKAREQSWRTALLISNTEDSLQHITIEQTDQIVSAIAERIARPKSFLFRKLLQLISSTERKGLAKVIEQLFKD